MKKNTYASKIKLIQMLLSLYFLFFSISVFNQNTAIADSLLLVLQTQQQEDTIRVNTLNELAWEYRKINPKKATHFAINAKKISDSLPFLNGTLTSLNRLGVIAIYQKDYTKAENIYLKIFSKEKERKNDYGIGRAANQLGLIYTKKEELNKALDFTLKANKKFTLSKNKKSIAMSLNNIGNIYRQLGDSKLAMQYFLKSLDIKKELGNKNDLAAIYLNIGILHIDLEHFNKAITYLLQSKTIYKSLHDDYDLALVYNNLGTVYFNLHNYKTSLIFYNKSLQIKTKLNLNDKDPIIYNNLGIIYYKQGKHTLALKNYLKCLDIENNIKSQKYSDTYSNIGHLYYKNKEYHKAINYYKKALKFAKNSNRKLDIMNALNYISNCYSELKQYKKSVAYNNHYIQLRDSMELNYKETIILKANYEEKQKQIELLEKDKTITQTNLEKKEAENKQKNILIYTLLISIALISLLFFSIIRGNKQKQIAQIAEKNREIEKQKADELLKEQELKSINAIIEKQKVEELLKKQELKSLNAMMDGQEKERKRIATDLHDRLGSMLSVVKIHFKSVEENLDFLKIQNQNQYKKANKLLDEACEEVRKISQDIASGVLTKFGLTTALEDLRDTLEDSNQIEVEFVSHGLKNRLHLDLEIAIYRIIQELISNILKYANASEISIQLLKSKNGLNIMVEDNGIGFEINNITPGMGLKNIESRVDAFDGSLQIDSKLGAGTTITIDIPLKNN